MSDHRPDSRADVELRLPADGAFASVLRTTTAGLAARLDFTIDDIEDLRIAVGEASALALAQADPDADLGCTFFLGTGEMTVRLSVSAIDDPEADTDSFAWQVLDTLTDDARAGSVDGVFSVGFTMRSHAVSDVPQDADD